MQGETSMMTLLDSSWDKDPFTSQIRLLAETELLLDGQPLQHINSGAVDVAFC